jgi:PIN domain nuclease of toxin-antitoxin system
VADGGYLLDTHVALWAAVGDDRLAPHHREIIERGTGLVLSVVSVWEISIKISIGKLQFDDDIAEMARQRSIELLRIDEVHATAMKSLPFHHRDPFDRMLIVQAQTERLHLLTSDRKFAYYDVSVI